MRSQHLLVIVLLLSPNLARADHEPGATIEEGLLVDVTLAGLDFLENQAVYFVPPEMPMDPVQSSTSLILCDLDIDIANMVVHIQPNSVSLVPQNGMLTVYVDMDVWINDVANPFDLDLNFDGVCDVGDQYCSVYIESFNVLASMDISLQVVDPGNGDPPYLDAIVPPPTHNLDTALTGDKIQMTDCAIGTIESILNLFGVSLIDLVLNFAAADLYAFIEEDLPTEIETALEEGFASANYIDTLDVMGVPVDIELVPADILVQTEGIRLAMNGRFDAPPADCVAPYDPGGSVETDNEPPAQDAAAVNHFTGLISDDLVGSALYAFWRGGVLCYVVDPADLGIPLDTSILALMADEEDRYLIERLWFGDAQAMVLRTLPTNVPEVQFDGSHDITPVVEDMGIEFYAFTQDRMARIVTVDADIAAGVDLNTPGDGSIAIDVIVDTDNMDPVVSYNEFVPELDEQIATNFNEIMPGLLDSVLGGFLGDLTFGPMLMAGIGLSDLQFEATGTEEDWLGAYATLDVIDPAGLDAIGCGEDGSGGCEDGCEDESCDSSCDVDGRRTGRAVWTGNMLLLSLVLLAVGYHRRRG